VTAQGLSDREQAGLVLAVMVSEASSTGFLLRSLTAWPKRPCRDSGPALGGFGFVTVHEAGMPASIQHWSTSTLSALHDPSHGIAPALATTSAYDHKSKAQVMASRSLERKRGLMCSSK
jgi:hypothetical protein